MIDAHCHAGTGGNEMTAPWDTTASLDRYLIRAAKVGITSAVLIPVFHSDYRRANAELGRLVGRSGGRFSFLAMVHPGRDAGRVGQLIGEAVERWGARGIKVHRHDGRITREICEAARRLRVPILYDVMGDAAPMELIATEFRDVPFILPHLGSFGDDWRAHLAVIDLLERHPNIYADTSGVRRFDYLAEAIRRAGATKLLFGSDGPWLHPGVELAKIRFLGLSAEQFGQVTSANAIRLGWGPSSPDSHVPSAALRVGAAGRVG